MTKPGRYFEIIATIIVVVFVMLMLRRCGQGDNISPTKTDTIKVKVDTIWKEFKTDTQWIPRPRGSYTPQPEKKPDSIQIHDTLEIYTPDPALNAHLKEYISFKYYRDTINTAYGYIVIIDTVNKNRIISRRSVSQFNVPTIEKIITLREPKCVVLYVGADLMGNQTTPLWGAGVNISLRFKNDKIWKVGAMLNKTGETMYSFGTQIPIRLRKQ